MNLYRKDPNRIDVRYQVYPDSAIGSRRGYLKIWGNGTDTNIDNFVVTYQTILAGITKAIPAKFAWKTTFPTQETGVSQSNLLVAGVFLFRITDPPNLRFWNVVMPGLDEKYFVEHKPGVSKERNKIDHTNANVLAFANWMVAHASTDAGEPLLEFVGGYRGFTRFITQ